MPKTRKMNRYKKKRGGMEAVKSAADSAVTAAKSAVTDAKSAVTDAAATAENVATGTTEEVESVGDAETGATPKKTGLMSWFKGLFSRGQTGGRKRKTKKGRTSKRTKKHGRRKRKGRR